LGLGLTTPHRKKKKPVTNVNKKPWTWTDSLDKRSKRKKMDMKFGTWNVRSMYRAGSVRVVGEEISKYKQDLMEYRRSDEVEVTLKEQANIYFSMEKGMKIMN
jgi:hypothetical protein